MTPADAVAGDE